MPCDYEDAYVAGWEDTEALSDMGLDETQIEDLQARATVAREKAKRKSFIEGDTKAEQDQAMTAAIEAAVKEWHVEQHAELESYMDQIRSLRKAVKVGQPH